MESKGKQGEACPRTPSGPKSSPIRPLPSSEVHRPPARGLEQDKAGVGVLDSPWETLKCPASNATLILGGSRPVTASHSGLWHACSKFASYN